MKKCLTFEYLTMIVIVVPTIYLCLLRDTFLEGVKNVRHRNSKDPNRRT